MFDFFVSYARADSSAFAISLAVQLREARWTVWMDKSDIPASVPWRSEVEHAITQSVMFLAIESSGWLSSPHCRLELDTAERMELPVVRIQPGDSGAKSEILAAVRAYREIPEHRRQALLLASSAATWRSAGQPSSLLARGRVLRAFVRLQKGSAAEVPLEARSYLRASQRRQRRRATAAIFAGLTLPALVFVAQFSAALLDAGTEQVEENISGIADASATTLYRDWNPYLALESVVQQDEGTYLGGSQLALALAVRVPNAWAVSTAGDDARVVSRTVETFVDDHSSSVATAEGTAVLVEAEGATGHTRLQLSGIVEALSWSPDGRWIAAAVGDHVDVVSTITGAFSTLRGSPASLVATGWTSDGEVVARTADGHLATWSFGKRDELIQSSDRGVVDAVVVGEDLVTAGDNGVFASTNLRTAETRFFDSDDTGGAWSLDSRRGVVVAVPLGTAQFVRLLDLDSLTFRDIPLKACSPTDISLSPDARMAFVACTNYLAARVDLASSKIVEVEQEYALTGVQAVNDGALFGSRNGVTIATDDELQFQNEAFWPGCTGPVRRFAADSEAEMVFPAGDETGLFSCSLRADREGAGWLIHRIIQPAPTSLAARAVALDNLGGLVAFGFADGSVRVLTTKNFLPVLVDLVLPVPVRAIAFTPDSRAIVVAGDDGRVVRVPLAISSERESAALVDIARDRLENAIELGLYRRLLDTSTSPSPAAG